MITELYVEGQAVDVSQSFPSLITYQVDDIKDFGAKHTNFSKTIVLPGTSNNNRIFGNVFAPESFNPYDAALSNVLANFNAAKSARAIIFQGNLQVFKGVLRMLEIINDRGRIEYEVAVSGELGGFVAAMGNKKLEDLDFSTYNRNNSVANIVDSWDNVPGSGVYFPLMDYGGYSTVKKDWQYGTFRPALYVKEYLTKIFEQTNYRVDCPLFDTPRFESLVIPHNQKLLTKTTSLIADAVKGPGQTPLDSATSLIEDSIAYFGFIGGLFTQSLDKKSFTYNGTDSSVHLKWNISGLYSASSNVGLRIYVRKNGALVYWDSRSLTNATENTPWERSYSDIALDLHTGDMLDFHADIQEFGFGGSPTYRLDVIDSLFQITSDNVVASPIALNDPIVMNDAIPRNILQKDFFSSILKLFNLYVYEDRYDERRLLIAPYIDFYDTDATTFIDWSDKIDRSKPIRYKPMSELNSRFYEFKFKSDSDYYNDLYNKRYGQNYGSRTYDSEYEFVNESNQMELIFAGTPLVGYQTEAKVYSTIFKRTGTAPTFTEEPTDSVIRILQTKKVITPIPWSIMNSATVLGTYSVYGYAGHFDDPDAPANDIQFGVPRELFFTLASGALNVNQFNVYYSPYMAEITDKDSKLMTATARLRVSDIYSLDFSKFIYIDGTLYRLVKIEDYNASEESTCKVQLLKVINLLY